MQTPLMAIKGNMVPTQRSEQTVADQLMAARLLPRVGEYGALSRLTDLASRLLSTPESPISAQVSLLTEVQTIAGGTGLQAGSVGKQSPLVDSLCAVATGSGGPLVVSDAPTDARVAHLPPVTSGSMGAYLGVPLVGSGGAVVGALCAFGPTARAWSAYDVALLEELSGAVLAQLELQALTTEFDVSRMRWDLAVEAAGIGTFAWDLQSGWLDGDDRMYDFFNDVRRELEPHGDEGLSRVHPADRRALEAAIDTAVRAVSDFRAEFRVLRADGQDRWLSVRGRAMPGPDGQAASLLGTAHDITELRTARDEAARLLEQMATGFAAVDRFWTVTYLNHEAARIVGIAADELVGRELWEAWPGLEDGEFGQHYKHAVETATAVEFEAYYPHLDGWFQVRAVPDSDGLSLYFLEVTGRHLDRERAAAATTRLAVLAAVSDGLATAGLKVGEAVAQVAQRVVPVLADWCVVSLIHGDRMTDVGSWHVDSTMRPDLDLYLAERLQGRQQIGPLQELRESRRPVNVPGDALAVMLPMLGSEQAKDALTRLAPESIFVVPLMARGQLTGTLTLVRGTDRPPLSDDEMTTANEVAVRAGLALDNATLYAEQRSLAEGLQRSLLTTPPEPDDCQISVRYVPAAEAASVGGDWFDSFLQADGSTVLVIGDVMGHDTAAAAAMGQVRGLLRGIAWYGGAAPAEVLSGLDAAMQGLQVNTTASAVVGRLERDSNDRACGSTQLRWSNAGHPPPLALHADGSVTALSGVETDLLLGIDPGTRRTESVVVLEQGCTVLLYTDGLIERRGHDLDEGLARLSDTLAAVSELPLEAMCDALLARMLTTAVDDDVALVAVRLHGQDRHQPNSDN